MSPCWAWLLAAVGLSLLGNCSPQTAADLPLVQVGDEVITAEVLRQYERDLPTAFRAAASGAAAQREHLQSLVDRQLMLLEAGNRGYRRMPELKTELEQLANKKLIDQVTAEYITRQVEVAEEELLQEYQEADLGWMVRPARILCATEEEARKIVRELEQGADFAALAAARSLKGATEKGGDLGHFFGPEDVAPVLQKAIFDLPVGGISAPIRTVEGYEVLTILDRYRIPFDRLKERLATNVRRRKWAARHLEYLEELKRKDSLSQTVASDPKALSDTLLLREARRQGFDLNAEFLAWREAKCEELLIRQLRRREVIDLLPPPSEAEVRQHYEAHIDGYSVPGTVYLTEILLNTREEAMEIRQTAEAGQSLEDLARKHSVRPRTEDGHGHVHAGSRWTCGPLCPPEFALLQTIPAPRETASRANPRAGGNWTASLPYSGWTSPLNRIGSPLQRCGSTSVVESSCSMRSGLLKSISTHCARSTPGRSSGSTSIWPG